MKTATLAMVVDGTPFAKKERRYQLGNLLSKIIRNEPYPKSEEKEFHDFFYYIEQLEFERALEKRLFLGLLSCLALKKDFRHIPLSYEWIEELYTYTILSNKKSLYKIFIFKNGVSEIDANQKFSIDEIWKVIEKTLATFFAMDCMKLKKVRNTSALDTKINLTWSLFPFWLFRYYPKIYKRWSNNKGKKYDGLSHIPFVQVMRYLPIFMLRKFEAYNNIQEGRLYVAYLATGNNIRKAPFIPVTLTRKMAFHFHDLFYNTSANVRISKEDVSNPFSLLDSGKYYSASFNYPFVYAFVRGLGGNHYLVKEFYSIYSQIDDADFQKSVIEFFVRFPISDRNILQRLLGYINHRRHEEGEAFSLKGRNLQSVTRDADAYYLNQQRANDIDFMLKNGILDAAWDGADYQPYEKEADDKEYQIVQLKQAIELVEESRNMNHCVRTYASACIAGRCSIWSLRRKVENTDDWISLVTIEVNASGKIVQAKARFNYRPEDEYMQMIREWERASLPHT